MSRSGLRVGTDIQAIDEVAAAVDLWGDRYLCLIFTMDELKSTEGPEGSRAASLAARFAAKESVMKVLRAGDEVLRWTSIEICRTLDGWPEVVLRDEALELARLHGLDEFAVSMSHGAGFATATVVATGKHDGKPDERNDP